VPHCLHVFYEDLAPTDFKFGLNLDKFKPLLKTPRANLVALARTAEAAERYDDMCKFMRALVEWLDGQVNAWNDAQSKKADAGPKPELSVEERNLLSVAYKNVIGARRASWRALKSDELKNDTALTPLVEIYQKQVEVELEAISKDVLHLLVDILVKHSSEPTEARVFYLKMTGDYYRYLAEFVENRGYDKKAAEMYSAATDIAQQKLEPTHPIRLGLALNFSVCHYEILKNHAKACEVAKKAFDEAITKLDKLDEASYKDSTLIMQLLRDNLTLWTSEQRGSDDNIQVEDVQESNDKGGEPHPNP